MLAGPGADQMQWSSPCAAVERAAGGLAVDRHHLLDPGGEGGHEPPEASLKRLGVEQAEQAGEGVVTGDAARQAHEATEQRRLGLAEQGHVDVLPRADSVAHNAISKPSSRSWRCALPVRGSARSAKHARNRSIAPLPNRSGGRLSRSQTQRILQISNAIPRPSQAVTLPARAARRQCAAPIHPRLDTACRRGVDAQQRPQSDRLAARGGRRRAPRAPKHPTSAWPSLELSDERSAGAWSRARHFRLRRSASSAAAQKRVQAAEWFGKKDDGLSRLWEGDAVEPHRALDVVASHEVHVEIV